MSNSNTGNSNERRRMIEKRVAIFIGISRYDHQVPLEGAYNDINELTRWILPAFDHVVTFTNADRSIEVHNEKKQTIKRVENAQEIVSYFDAINGDLFEEIGFKRDDDLLWVHFTGHGVHHDQQGWVLLFQADRFEEKRVYPFTDTYLKAWFRKTFTRGRVLITIAACRTRIALGPSADEIRLDRNIRGMLILASTQIGSETFMRGHHSQFIGDIRKVIDMYRDQSTPHQQRLTIRDLVNHLNCPQSAVENVGLERATLIEGSKLKQGTHDLLSIRTWSDSRHEVIPTEHVRYVIRYYGSKNKTELKSDFECFNDTRPNERGIPLFLYWSGRARTVGFHLFINEKESINLQEFVACLNATGHRTIVLWLDCQFVIEDDIKRLCEEMAKNRDKTLHIIVREALQQSQQGVFLLKHFERTTERWCNPNPQERLRSILSEIARECSVHVYPDPTAP